MIVPAAIQNIPAKVCTDSFVAVNLHLHHQMTFHNWIKKISPAFKMGETAYFLSHDGSYYYAMPYVCKKMSVPFRIEVMYIIDCFFEEAPSGKSPWTKQFFCISFVFFS